MSPSATEHELQAALRQRLQASGALEKLKAQLRAEVFKVQSSPCRSALVLFTPPPSHTRTYPQQKQHLAVHPPATAPPAPTRPPKMVLLVNYLIQQYLSQHGYGRSLSVFRNEAQTKGEDVGRMDAMVVKEDLGLMGGGEEEGEEECLLFGIVHALQALKMEEGRLHD